jgi:hypothetical protein
MLEERDMRQALSSAKRVRDFVLNLTPEIAPKEQEQNGSSPQDDSLS